MHYKPLESNAANASTHQNRTNMKALPTQAAIKKKTALERLRTVNNKNYKGEGDGDLKTTGA